MNTVLTIKRTDEQVFTIMFRYALLSFPHEYTMCVVQRRRDSWL